MSGFDWIKDSFAYLKKYPELGKICFEDVGKFEEIIQRIKEAKARQRGDAASAPDNAPGGDPALGTGIRHR